MYSFFLDQISGFPECDPFACDGAVFDGAPGCQIIREYFEDSYVRMII